MTTSAFSGEQEDAGEQMLPWGTVELNQRSGRSEGSSPICFDPSGAIFLGRLIVGYPNAGIPLNRIPFSIV